jgi:hypothetical protein
MRIQIYHFYSNEVIETYESVEDAAKENKPKPNFSPILNMLKNIIDWIF